VCRARHVVARQIADQIARHAADPAQRARVVTRVKLLSTARDLTRRRARERTGLFVAEGVRTVEELLASPLGATGSGALRGALVSPSLSMTERGAALRAALESRCTTVGVPFGEISDADLATASDTDAPQGVVVVAKQLERSFDQLSLGVHSRLVVLDAVQDPGNVGTILRTAEALGADAVVALPGSADLWNSKVVRGAMGSLFRLPAFRATPDALTDFCAAQQVEVWTADGAGEPVDSWSGRAPDRLAIVVGNEGSGVSSALAQVAQRSVAIPVRTVESLNVAIATGILLYALRR